MITYVNNVYVGKGNALLTSMPTTYNASNVDKFIAINPEKNTVLNADTITSKDTVKIGYVTKKTYTDKNGKHHVIRWSNPFKKEDIKSYSHGVGKTDTEDKVEIDFSTSHSADISNLAKGGMRVILRLTFKDLPTRYRKWTESYEYVTVEGDTPADIANGLKDQIQKNYKRARVNVTVTAGKLTITAEPYDDDDIVDSISWANKVRFNANVWYTDPNAAGFASKNKNAINGLTIKKTPGIQYPASAKLVRDREAMGFGYLGILNRGEGTYPIIKPDMNVQLDKKYMYLIVEFERPYHTADDLIRKTKETVECYDVFEGAPGLSSLESILTAFVSGINDTPASTPPSGASSDNG